MAKFRVSARTVDMLGRQQIAGIPTAISELFKNAHDAYARNVEVDYYRDDGLFVLRDDGLGMSRKDFEERWLTLGTESKVGSAGLGLPPRDPSQQKRPILGEKGIGRLAIAIIGSQVLVLSRASVNGKPSNTTVAAYLHWGLFEVPGLELDDIYIPVREFPGGTLPSANDVRDMVDSVAETLENLDSPPNKKRIDGIRSDMAMFDADPLEFSEYLGEPSLVNGGTGTHFYIVPANPIIDDDIDNRQALNKATRFEKHLIGFTNTMTPNHPRPTIIARFRDHKDEGSPIELIGEQAFFTPDEYEKVDHHFHGRFDEYGQFRGRVGIYQMKPEGYVLNWNESDGRRTDCGPFKLSFAYMQGTQRDSLVPPKEHTRLRRKLDRHGGLYIYRDGIRVQPYGDSDYDWLDIERNRTLGAGYYFYSYRRMFGVIELGQDLNRKLTEKAGREGFRENKAYRQMRSILMNFFLQTAGDFFREEGKYADVHTETKGELNRNAIIRAKNEKRAKARRSKFRSSLHAALGEIDNGNPEQEVEEVMFRLQGDVDKLMRRKIPNPRKAVQLIQYEKKVRLDLHNVRKRLEVAKPRGVGFPRQLANEWHAYLQQMARLDTELFRPCEKKAEQYVSVSASMSNVPMNDVARLDSAVSEYKDGALKDMRQLRGSVNKLSRSLAEEVKEQARISVVAVNQTVDDVMAEVELLQKSGKSIDQFAKMRTTFIDQIVSVYEVEKLKLERLRDQLNEVSRIWDEENYDSAELTEALEEELEELRARRDADLELAQIGLALNSISHEFEKTVGSLRNGLRKLQAWANANPDLTELYRDMRVSFDHLDEYLSLFTPLDRRLHRKRIKISGKEIHDFMSKLFQVRLKRHSVTLNATREFLKSSTSCYPSSLYPPFVNLIDNAIFWLQRNHNRPREILLDVEDEDLLVNDNGPGVSTRDRENIFELNFSRKPGGRGMGLHISRETLAQVSFDLTLDPARKTEGATFRISPRKAGKND